MPLLDRDNDKALYAQLIAHFREQILGGSLPPGSRLPTELDLAEKYTISRGTVRQAMTALVSEGLLERIQGRGTFVRVAPPVKHLSGVETIGKRIGLLLSYPGSELDLDILRGVEHAAKLRGYQVTFAYTEESAEQQTNDINRLRADGVMGLIIYPLSNITYSAAIWKLDEDRIPFVLVDRYFPDLDTDYVTSDNFSGGYRATEHLIILGYNRISFCYSHFGTLTTTSVRDRFEGYRKALEEYGLPYDESLVFEFPRRVKGLPDPYHEFLSRPNRPEAIFASLDNEAANLMKAAQQIGLRIPENLALVGFDNLRFTIHSNPPLTTVAQSCHDMGVQAVDLIIKRIEGMHGPKRHIELPINLVIRESCGVKLRVRAALKE